MGLEFTSLCALGLVASAIVSTASAWPDDDDIDPQFSGYVRCAPKMVYDKERRLCLSTVACEEGKYFKAEYGKCVSCKVGTHFDATVQRCEPDVPCKIRELYDTYHQECKRATCSRGMYFDINKRKCRWGEMCEEGKYYDFELKMCTKCKVGSHYNETVEHCHPDVPCQDEEYYDLQTQTCTKVSCSPNFHYDNVRVRCVPSCPEGQQFNTYLRKCGSCKAGSYYHRYMGRCQPEIPCANGLSYNGTSQECENIFCGKGQRFDSFFGRCQNAFCGENRRYNSALDRCEWDTACSGNEHFDFSIHACRVCSGDTHYDTTYQMCEPNVPCGAYESFNYRALKCEEIQCGLGRQYDVQTGICEPRGPCPPGYHRDRFSNCVLPLRYNVWHG